MTLFDEAFEKAVGSHKYDVLMGRAPDVKSLISDIVNNIYEKFLKAILERININVANTAAAADADILRNIFIAIAALSLAAAVFFAVRHFMKLHSPGQKTMREIIGDLKDGSVTYEQLLKQAELFAEKGMYREAVRFEYISLLWVLNSRSVIYLTDYKTNTQLKREIWSNAPIIHAKFAEVVAVFNLSWFGHKKIASETYLGNKNRVAELIAEAKCYEKTA